MDEKGNKPNQPDLFEACNPSTEKTLGYRVRDPAEGWAIPYGVFYESSQRF